MKALLVVVVCCAAFGCANPVSDCATTCLGCCDSNDVCQAGTGVSACGVSGAACTTCLLTQQCSLGACTSTSGGADGGNGVALDGGSADGGAACTSGLFWTQGDLTASRLMSPGKACIACHLSYGVPLFDVAGTVYPSLHEPDECFGSPVAPTVVELIDPSSGALIVTMPVLSNGNFFSSRALVIPPYLARVSSGGRTVTAVGVQTNGDCNACHTVAGAQGAAGRIVSP
jgi:hypothetical protein